MLRRGGRHLVLARPGSHLAGKQGMPMQCTIRTSLKSLRLRKLLDKSSLAYWALLGLTEPYWALLGLTRPYSVLLGLNRSYSVLLVLTGPYWSVLVLTGPYWVLMVLNGP